MPISPEETFLHLSRRAELARQQTSARAHHARAVAEQIADLLVTAFGASTVVIFGSLASGRFHARSDIDLAVSGIAPDALDQARCAIDALGSPFQVDLVPFERLPSVVRATLTERGVVLRGHP